MGENLTSYWTKWVKTSKTSQILFLAKSARQKVRGQNGPLCITGREHHIVAFLMYVIKL